MRIYLLAFVAQLAAALYKSGGPVVELTAANF